MRTNVYMIYLAAHAEKISTGMLSSNIKFHYMYKCILKMLVLKAILKATYPEICLCTVRLKRLNQWLSPPPFEKRRHTVRLVCRPSNVHSISFDPFAWKFPNLLQWISLQRNKLLVCSISFDSFAFKLPI